MASEFAQEILQTHNKYRAKHGAPDLKISDKLTTFAQEWADKLSSNDKAEHRPDNPYGENLYMAGSTDPNWKLKGEKVVKSWYDEIKFHKFGEASPKNTSEVGHFTQLVWKETTDLGIGEAKSKAGKVYVVCNYDPPGNVLREFGKNVLPLDKIDQDEYDNRQSMEDDDEANRKRIELTESLKKIGIRFVEPNIQIVESMKRLYAVPSEKIRVWSVWLTKIEEEANEWHFWLRSHINLMLRMSEYLQKAQEEVEREKKSKDEGTEEEEIIVIVEASEQKDASIEKQKGPSDGKDQGRDERKVEKNSGADGADEILEEPPEEISNVNNERNSEEKQLTSASVPEEMEETLENEEVLSSEAGEEPSKPEPGEKLSAGSEILLKEENNEDTNDDDRNREGERKPSNGEEDDEKATVGLEKIAWPIGVPWEPVATTLMKEEEVAEKKDDKVKVIPIPANEEDMLRLIRDVKHQATIYESIYKHWLEVSDRAVKEIMNRKVLPSERVPTDEEVPYFFHLYVDPDIDIAIDNDDETILLPDPTREKITCEFTNLYFNLADKPGKGGKPWL